MEVILKNHKTQFHVHKTQRQVYVGTPLSSRFNRPFPAIKLNLLTISTAETMSDKKMRNPRV
jgi:hypothetical protein